MEDDFNDELNDELISLDLPELPEHKQQPKKSLFSTTKYAYWGFLNDIVPHNYSLPISYFELSARERNALAL